MDARRDGADDPGLPGKVVQAEKRSAQVESMGGGGGDGGSSMRLRARRAVQDRHSVPS